MNPAAGTRLGPYIIASKLGEGGMGVVYAAEDPRLERRVAIKFLAPELTRDETAKERFLQEARAVSAIDHANVCTIYEINEIDDGQLYLVMAHYDGETLKQRLVRGPLPIAEAVDIGRQIGEGLAAAHAAGVVHRDIKPANIIVMSAGVAKILDFGIAKLTGATGLTETGITLGTVAYMSPEQINGEEADQQSDVWALGAVLYEMLTGQPPFRGDRPAVVMHAITGSAPTPVRELCPETPPDLVRVVTRALEKSRSRRYEMARELVAALPNGSTAASPASATPGDDDATRSTAATLAPSTVPPEVPSIAVLPFANMSADPEQEYFCEGLAEELIDALARLDGLRVVARTSAFRFKGDAIDLREVGDKLNVRTVLEGSVRKAGNRLRINAQLINTDDGYHLWSARYDRDMDDIFAVQDEIARAVVNELQGKLLAPSGQPLVVRPTKSLEAYACYMQGRHYRFIRYDVPKADRCFEEAVRHDPSYAAAWAGVAEGAVLAGIYRLRPPREASAKARTAMEHALSLDADLAEGYEARAKIRFWFDWEWDDAERDFQRAIELNPANADTYATYSHFLGYMHRTEDALAQMAIARELDPLSAHASTTAGVALLVARRYEEALDSFADALDLQPEMSFALWMQASTFVLTEHPQDAVRCLRKVSTRTSELTSHLGMLGHALAYAGEKAEARQILARLKERGKREYVSPFDYALIHVALGETDETVAALEHAFEERSTGLIHLQLPRWAELRAHPRIRHIRQQMQMPDPPAGDPLSTSR